MPRPRLIFDNSVEYSRLALILMNSLILFISKLLYLQIIKFNSKENLFDNDTTNDIFVDLALKGLIYIDIL
jgi:hypothetical protein